MRAFLAACLLVGLALVFALPLPAGAATREVDIGGTTGGYYFEDRARGDRSKIVIQQGDRINFVLVDTAYPPHSANVDELGIKSGDMYTPGETYPTEPIEKPGTYLLYCKAHRDDGHVATLVVERAATAPGTGGTPAPTPQGQKPPGGGTASARPSGVPSPSAGAVGGAGTPGPGATPGGVQVGGVQAGKPVSGSTGAVAAPAGLRILHRRPNWTRSVRLAGLAVFPLAVLAGYALLQDVRRRRLAEAVAVAGRAVAVQVKVKGRRPRTAKPRKGKG